MDTGNPPMTASLFDLEGKVAAVSGGARGLGRAMALALAGAGADVVIADIDAGAADETAGEIESMGRRGAAVHCDISNPEQIDAWFERIDAFGTIDFLGNVAGGGVLKAPEKLSLEEVRKVLDELVACRFYCCQQAGRRMLAAGRGSIVNIGSLASVTALGRGHISYSMAHGRSGADDEGAEHGMGGPRGARQRHPAGAGAQPGARGAY